MADSLRVVGTCDTEAYMHLASLPPALQIRLWSAIAATFIVVVGNVALSHL